MDEKINEKITIQARKYGGRLHYEWQATLLEVTEDYALVYCEANRTFIHHSKQKQFNIPYPSLEWFFFKQGYTVAISFKPEGLMYYCNIALPATYLDGVISFVDLDLDYIKEAGEQWQVVDEDEFEHHQVVLHYSDDIIAFARSALTTLQQAVKTNVYPFSLTEQQCNQQLQNVMSRTKVQTH